MLWPVVRVRALFDALQAASPAKEVVWFTLTELHEREGRYSLILLPVSKYPALSVSTSSISVEDPTTLGEKRSSAAENLVSWKIQGTGKVNVALLPGKISTPKEKDDSTA